MPRKILTVIGARPQFIKAAVVSREILKHGDLAEIVVNTGQHYDLNMADIFFQELALPQPRYDLHIGSGSHGVQTGRMLEALDPILVEARPDAMLVYGDTNSTLAGALAAAKLHIPVAHVEAGLRSFNRKMPEEINRVLTDHLASALYAPTQTAVTNLGREGISGSTVCMVGDVMYDLALQMQHATPAVPKTLENLGVKGRYVLATIHRAENTDDVERLRTIVGALTTLSKRIPVVLPLHPRTREALRTVAPRAGTEASALHMVAPVGYGEMVALEQHAVLIVTDSGGIQKEAYFHRVPCVTLRDETEWVELVEAGWNRLAPPLSEASVLQAAEAALEKERPPYKKLYGDGDAARRIVDDLRERLESAWTA